MLSDILWEDQKLSLNNRIATSTTIIFPGPIFQDLTDKKNPPRKLITDGFSVYYYYLFF